MQHDLTIALFGEAERGEFRTAYFCEELAQLDEYFGNPPPESRGLFYAVQALLYKSRLVFFRVAEEGFSKQDYLVSLKMLDEQKLIPQLDAICAPGVGDQEILGAIQSICDHYHCIMISNESDLYDFLTQR